MIQFDDSYFEDDGDIISDYCPSILRNYMYGPCFNAANKNSLSMKGDGEEVGLLVREENKTFGILPFSSDEHPEYKIIDLCHAAYVKKEDVTKDEWQNLMAKAIERKDNVAIKFLQSFVPRTSLLKLHIADDIDYNPEEVEHIKCIIEDVNKLLLPTELQEDNCKTFGDLYETLNTVELHSKKAHSGYEDGTDCLGCYVTTKDRKAIYLYIDSIKEHIAKDDYLDEMVKYVYIHELFHVYFDTYYPAPECNYSKLEEPIVEHLALETIKYSGISHAYNNLKADVSNKFANIHCRHYALGAEDIGMEIAKNYKYMKLLINDEKIKEYVASVRNLDKTRKECLDELIAVFEEE